MNTNDTTTVTTTENPQTPDQAQKAKGEIS